MPREFVHAVDEAAKAFVTVPRRVVMDAPEVDRKGFFDRRKAARHYGLAESYIAPTTEGRGETLGHDPAWGSERGGTPSIAGPRSESICGRGIGTSTGQSRRHCSATGTSTGAGRRPTSGRELAEAVLGEAREDLLAADLLVVPGQRDLTDEVRIRGFEPVEAPEGGREPADAPLATDAADLDRLGLDSHAPA